MSDEPVYYDVVPYKEEVGEGPWKWTRTGVRFIPVFETPTTPAERNTKG